MEEEKRRAEFAANEVAKLRDEVAKLGQRNEQSRKERSKRDSEIEALKEDLSIAEETQVELKHALRCSKSEEDWLRRECKDAKEAKAESERSISKLDGQLRLVEEERKQMQKILSERNKLLQNQGERIDQMQRRRVGLEQSVSSLTSALQALAGEQQKRLGLGVVGGVGSNSVSVTGIGAAGELAAAAAANAAAAVHGGGADVLRHRVAHLQQQQQQQQLSHQLGMSLSSPALEISVNAPRSYAYGEPGMAFRSLHQQREEQVGLGGEG